MRYGLNVGAEPFAGYTEFDEFEGFDFETPGTSAATCPPPKTPGAVGRYCPEYLRWVQSSLNRIMGLGLKVDGRPGKITKSAIKSFQQRSGLAADGSLGAKTEAALIK